MMIKKYFNLIEIALAIAVIAIGVSSIMVLFPVGINSTNDSVADNIVPDVAESMLAYLEAATNASWIDSNGTSVATNIFLGKIPILPGNREQAIAMGDETIKSLGDGIFGVQRYTKVDNTRLVDFDAVVAVTCERPKIYYNIDGDGGAKKPDATQLDDKTKKTATAVTFRVEISFPAAVPYANREKRVFWLDLYNTHKKN